MFVKYDEYELLELFLTEGESLSGNVEDGNIKYSRTKSKFSLTMYIRTYEQQVSIFLKYKNNDVFYVDLKNITKIERKDNYLKLCDGGKQLANIHFGEIFSINVSEQ
ncbi:conserved hypothetical protein [Shouchella clausii KSM-K16]|uniref:Uncharacterized protein n=1 Tax=Shouchella clausii (strain KSM-K16) TaxID=66692 RepID=Q5WJ48_SHOC1|nr:hypothetical protein [Shouchella clausii]BAD63607.1 conserved hypothetical protein [Shouchella clausii KSM-K16]